MLSLFRQVMVRGKQALAGRVEEAAADTNKKDGNGDARWWIYATLGKVS